MLRQMSLVCVLSAFLNNTPLVSFFTPLFKGFSSSISFASFFTHLNELLCIVDWARQHGLAPSLFLIPLSYSAIMGGLITVIG